MVGIPDLITCAKFGEDRLRGLAVAWHGVRVCDINLSCVESRAGNGSMGQMGHENRMGHMGHGSLSVDP